ncbi:MAG: hypothetical protein ACRC3H_07115 [Lachnospiraceae bacterium]
MNCPKCGGELRESEKYPGHALCDNCRKKYKLPNEDDYEESAELNEESAGLNATPKKKKGGKLKWVIIAVVALVVIGALNGGNNDTDKDGDSADAKTEQEDAEDGEAETDSYGWTDDDYINFRAISSTMADEYIANYSTPWGSSEWRFLKLDDSERVVATTKVTFDNQSEKQTGLWVFTPGDDSRFTPHFFGVGSTVYYDDGTAQELIDNAAEQ